MEGCRLSSSVTVSGQKGCTVPGSKLIKFTSPGLIFLFLFAAGAQAEPYEVLVVDIAAADNNLKIEQFEKDAGQFNGLHRKGYSGARPYFNLLEMSNGKVFFVFGYRGPVQGIHRRNYPETVKNLRRLQIDGKPRYPEMHWLPVAEIRKLLKKP